MKGASWSRRLGVVLAASATLGLATAAYAGATTYTYDSLGRVVTVTDNNGVVTQYVYDLAGNRTGQALNMTLPIPQPSNFSVPENSIRFPLAPIIIGAPATSVANTSNPPNGGVVVDPAQPTRFLYTPATCYYGPDSFLYTASGSAGPSPASAPISINVTLAPAAVTNINQVVATNSQNNWVNITNVDLSSHISCGQAAGITITQGPMPGATAQVVMNGTSPMIQYTPAQNFTGTDTLKFAATNAAGQSPVPATVTLTVNSSRSIWYQFPWGHGTW